MINKSHINGRRASAGMAAVEFAILLPVLLLLVFSLFDLARAIQANLILVNMSREGASLASRTSWCTPTSGGCSNIMKPITSTSPPLDMNDNGMIYITVVKGHSQGGNIRNVVQEQYRCNIHYSSFPNAVWDCGGSYSPPSDVWNCGSSGTNWTTEPDHTQSCRGIPANDDDKPTANVMTENLATPEKEGLADGDFVYAVEVFYHFNMLFGGMNLGLGITTPQIDPDLRALTVL